MIDSGRPCRGGAPVLALHRQLSPINAGSWDFRWVPVCSSTEILLKQWLLQSPLMLRPRVVAARQQRWGVGQRGRVWRAPKGGVWLSAALPVVSDGPNPNNTGAGLLGLALALSQAFPFRSNGRMISWRVGASWLGCFLVWFSGATTCVCCAVVSV